jgi:hypothetical protein
MKKTWIWGLWLLIALALASLLGVQMFVDTQKPDFLIGQTSHGHYQIELECTACHTEPFGGPEIIQDACTSCHGNELKIAQDSHPKTKFTDPRNVDRLKQIDARYCVSCHSEHNEQITQAMGVTLPSDFCFHCHQEIAEERPSHKNMPFDTCASSGCHNYHDNRALYEDFLADNAHGNWLKPKGKQADSNILAYVQALGQVPKQATSNDLPDRVFEEAEDIHPQWLGSAHELSNVGCNNCHGDAEAWQAKPTQEVCADCHTVQVDSFLQSKHGMRIAQNLPAMSPQQSVNAYHKLDFKDGALNNELDCNSCHDAHTASIEESAVNACLSCHNDQHSLAFESSPHGESWQQFKTGALPKNQAVSCASCHMPVLETEIFGKSHMLVTHNQNITLRPNEKMIRPVCMNCHSLAFSIDALADPDLIKNNFAGQPSQHIPSIDMSLERAH